MKDKELREDFNTLRQSLCNNNIIDEDLYVSEEMRSVTGAYGYGAMERIARLTVRLTEQERLIKLLMEHLCLEVHKPDCTEVLRKKPKQ